MAFGARTDPNRMASSGSVRACTDPNTCQKECQVKCENIRHIERLQICQVECQVECQNLCQMECQIVLEFMSDKMSKHVSDRLPKRMPDRMADKMTKWMVECQIDCQLKCQVECQMQWEYQLRCQNVKRQTMPDKISDGMPKQVYICRIECQIEFHTECQRECEDHNTCQHILQIECQIECQLVGVTRRKNFGFDLLGPFSTIPCVITQPESHVQDRRRHPTSTIQLFLVSKWGYNPVLNGRANQVC